MVVFYLCFILDLLPVVDADVVGGVEAADGSRAELYAAAKHRPVAEEPAVGRVLGEHEPQARRDGRRVIDRFVGHVMHGRQVRVAEELDARRRQVQPRHPVTAPVSQQQPRPALAARGRVAAATSRLALS